jgi:hypothetical protein
MNCTSAVIAVCVQDKVLRNLKLTKEPVVCSLLEGPFGPEQSQREDLEAGDAGVA